VEEKALTNPDVRIADLKGWRFIKFGFFDA